MLWFVLRFMIMAIVLMSYVGAVVVVVDAFNLSGRWLLLLIPLGIVVAVYYLLTGAPNEETNRRNRS